MLAFVLLGWMPLLVLPSCESEPCLSEVNTRLGIEFCDKNPEEIVLKPYSFRFFDILQNKTYSDSLTGNPVERFQFYFPTGGDSFCLAFRDSLRTDSIWFSYSRKIFQADESCGFYYGFKNLKVDRLAGTRFSKAVILSNEGDSTQKVHVRIFW